MTLGIGRVRTVELRLTRRRARRAGRDGGRAGRPGGSSSEGRVRRLPVPELREILPRIATTDANGRLFSPALRGTKNLAVDSQGTSLVRKDHGPPTTRRSVALETGCADGEGRRADGGIRISPSPSRLGPSGMVSGEQGARRLRVRTPKGRGGDDLDAMGDEDVDGRVPVRSDDRDDHDARGR